MQQESCSTLRGVPVRGPRVLVLRAGHPFPKGKNPRLAVDAGGERLGEVDLLPFTNAYTFPLGNRSEEVELRFALDGVFPREMTGDPRELGMVVEQIAVYADEALALPTVLEIESSTLCNIHPPCVMCYPKIFDTRHYKGEMEAGVFQKLIARLREFRTISLHGVGEPLLGKSLFAILDSIDTDRTFVQFNSNGLLLTEEVSRKLIQKKLKLIDFSIDAATAETYRKIRRSDFSRVVGNIRRLAELKNELGFRHPVIKMNMTLMNENLPEVVAFIELAKSLHAEIVHLTLLNPYPEYRVENGDFVFNYREQRIDTGSAFFRETVERAGQRANDLGIELLLEFSGEAGA
jgi:pyruvate-formate lyase-activating enzyme